MECKKQRGEETEQNCCGNGLLMLPQSCVLTLRGRGGTRLLLQRDSHHHPLSSEPQVLVVKITEKFEVPWRPACWLCCCVDVIRDRNLCTGFFFGFVVLSTAHLRMDSTCLIDTGQSCWG